MFLVCVKCAVLYCLRYVRIEAIDVQCSLHNKWSCIVDSLVVLQLSIILLVTRVPEVHLVTHGNYISEVGTYKMEKVEWLEKRFNYLKEEMLMVEYRLESMRHEYALLKSHIQSFERLNAKSWLLTSCMERSIKVNSGLKVFIVLGNVKHDFVPREPRLPQNYLFSEINKLLLM